MKKQIHNLIILDESGSMQSIRSEIIAGFNELVQNIDNQSKLFPDQEHFVSFITFNTNGIKTRLFKQAANSMDSLTEESFTPDAMTPLFDAIGFTVNKLKSELKEDAPTNVLVTILTDGMENASVEFNGKQIKELINELKSKNWTFTYIGTDHNVEVVATSISISNVMSFTKSAMGVKKMFAQENNSRVQYFARLDNGEDVSENYFAHINLKDTESSADFKTSNP